MHLIKKYLKIVKDQAGIGLIEVIASFTITIIVITALVGLALYTTRSSLNSKLLLEGTKIAVREVERVRGFRDTTSWDQFITDLTTANCLCAPAATCSLKCYMAVNPGFSVVGTETSEIIDNQTVTRYFNVTQDATNPNNIVRVSVSVLWNVAGVAKSTHVYTDLTNWQTK